MLLGPLAGARTPPFLASLPEQMHIPAIAAHVEHIYQRSPAVVEQYDFPARYPENFRRSKAFDPRWTYRLKNVVVSPLSGLVWLDEVGVVLQESYGSLYRSLGWGDIRHELLTTIDDAPLDVPIIQFAPTGFYHWMFEILPAAMTALDIEPEAHLLTSSRSPDYVNEVAERLVGRSRVVHADRPMKVRQAIMAGIEPFSGFVQHQDLELLRNTLPAKSSQRTETLYISRLKDQRRALANERAVEEGLGAIGARVVYAQDLAFSEQQALLAGAKVIISPHGAGLANIVWTQSAERVIEIFPYGHRNDCYARLSRSLGIKYDYLVATHDGAVPIDRLTTML